MPVKTMLLRLLRDSSGVTATEYGLLIAGIGLALFGASQGLAYGNKLMWNLVHQRYTAATGSGTP